MNVGIILLFTGILAFACGVMPELTGPIFRGSAPTNDPDALRVHRLLAFALGTISITLGAALILLQIRREFLS
jgi:hypothetical protein